MSAVAQRYFARERGEAVMVGEMVDEPVEHEFDVVVCVKHAVTTRVSAASKDEAEEIAQELVQKRAPLLAGGYGARVEELDICVHKVTPR